MWGYGVTYKNAHLNIVDYVLASVMWPSLVTDMVSLIICKLNPQQS